jgi:hypothetical protein
LCKTITTPITASNQNKHMWVHGSSAKRACRTRYLRYFRTEPCQLILCASMGNVSMECNSWARRASIGNDVAKYARFLQQWRCKYFHSKHNISLYDAYHPIRSISFSFLVLLCFTQMASRSALTAVHVYLMHISIVIHIAIRTQPGLVSPYTSLKPSKRSSN